VIFLIALRRRLSAFTYIVDGIPFWASWRPALLPNACWGIAGGKSVIRPLILTALLSIVASAYPKTGIRFSGRCF
jgi:hypothetical protein